MNDAHEQLRYFQSRDGLTLCFREFGDDSDRAPVICLPGLTRNSRDFEDLNPHLARQRRVLSPDLRGRGLSDYDTKWKNYHPLTYVADTFALMDHVGIEGAVLVGTSLGGLVSMIMAAQHPERIVGIVLNDVGPEIATEGLARITRYAGKLGPVDSWDAAQAQAQAVYGAALPGLDDDAWARLTRRAYRADDNGVPVLDADPQIGTALRELGPTGPDPWETFEALGDVPILLLRGAHSDILSTDIVARMRAKKPDLKVVEIPDRGHVPLLDEPASLAAIDTFLEQLP